jgi:hypothetical protein
MEGAEVVRGARHAAARELTTRRNSRRLRICKRLKELPSRRKRIAHRSVHFLGALLRVRPRIELTSRDCVIGGLPRE